MVILASHHHVTPPQPELITPALRARADLWALYDQIDAVETDILQTSTQLAPGASASHIDPPLTGSAADDLFALHRRLAHHVTALVEDQRIERTVTEQATRQADDRKRARSIATSLSVAAASIVGIVLVLVLG
jgi:hypothetical protein